MIGEKSSIGRKSLWTMGTYVASAGIRFSTNIVLSRLLGPEILGVVVVAQAIRSGAELLTDTGPEQNVVHSPHGNEERFLNTIWTMQITRGAGISLVCAGLAGFIAKFYRIDVAILIAMSAAPFLNSISSTSIFTLVKNMNVKVRNLFEVSSEFIGLVLNISLAFALRSVWAPIIGILMGLGIRSALSYLFKHPKHRLILDKSHMRDIFHFSKWIMISSLALYASVYTDRLFLGRVVTLSVLGVYGLARAISDLPQAVAGRLAFQIVFPYIANSQDGAGSAGRMDLVRTRRHFLLLVALGISTVMAWSDWAVKILYDKRYIEAGWMLLFLLVGSWMGVLASLGEAVLFGYGKPKFVSLANLVRVGVMAAVIPGGFALWGLTGAILALPASEFARYLVLLASQRKLSGTFVFQDLAMTLGLAALFAVWIAARILVGLGVPWAMMP